MLVRFGGFEGTHIGGHSINAVVLRTIDIVLVTKNADGHAWELSVCGLRLLDARVTYGDGERWGA